MPGMNSGLNVDDPTVVAAFKATLAHQGLIALLIFILLGAAWAGLRAWLAAAARSRQAATGPAADGTVIPAVTEPSGRLALAIGFGNLWLLDGILQAQPRMAIGLPSLVIEPAAATSPSWVRHLVNWAGTAWSYHPVQAAAATVWIQVGIGLWILLAPRGALSRLAGLVSVGWGLIVWVFGEAFGGIFAPGLSWLTGGPGSVAVYVVGGALLALPERAWRSPRLGRFVLAGLGAFLIGMAILQAWPGRGFWRGTAGGQAGSLASMTKAMAVTPQPGLLSGWVSAFTAFDEAHGFAVNLVTVAVLAITGGIFATGRIRLIRPALLVFAAFCLATWVLIQDLGVFGGVGTDPNSMIPFILLAVSGYLAVTRVPADPREQAPGTDRQAPSPAERTASLAGAGGRAVLPGAPASPVSRWRPGLVWPALVWPALARRAITASGLSVAALGAVGLIVLGAVPMAVAQVSPNADPILADSVTSVSLPVNYPAPGFALTDQYRRTVTLAGLHGTVVLVSFCTADCLLLGRELRQAARLLAPVGHQVALAGIVLSTAGRPATALPAPGYQAGLTQTPGWLELTGAPAQLQQVWHAYWSTAQDRTAGLIAKHADETYVIDRAGRVRQVFGTGPVPDTAAVNSSFAVLFASAARLALSGQ